MEITLRADWNEIETGEELVIAGITAKVEDTGEDFYWEITGWERVTDSGYASTARIAKHLVEQEIKKMLLSY